MIPHPYALVVVLKTIDLSNFFDGRLIHWRHLLCLLVYTKIPPRDRSKGMECIVGKLVKPNAKGLLDDFWLELDLLEEDKNLLQSQAGALPFLQYPVSKEVAEDFIDKFLCLNPSVRWVPWIVNDGLIQSDRGQRERMLEQETESLSHLLTCGDVNLVTSSGLRLSALDANGFFTAKSAKDFLSRRGCLALVEEFIKATVSNPIVDDIGLPKGPVQRSSESEYLGLSRRLLLGGIEEYVTSQLRGRSKVGKDVSVLVDGGSVCAGLDGNSLGKSSVPPSISEAEARLKDEAKDQASLSVAQSEVDVNQGAIDSAVDGFLSLKDVAELLRCSRAHIYNMMKKGHRSFDATFPVPYKVMRRTKFSRSEIDAWISSAKTRNQIGGR